MARVSLPSSLVRAALRRPTAQLVSRCTPTTTAATTSGTTRSFSNLPILRPTLPSTSHRAIFRTNTTTHFAPSPSTTTTTTTGETLDLLPKSSITAHPAFAGCASQIRCGPRPTMSGASRLVQKRRHGFLGRTRSPGGRKMILRRRVKGWKKLGH